MIWRYRFYLQSVYAMNVHMFLLVHISFRCSFSLFPWMNGTGHGRSPERRSWRGHAEHLPVHRSHGVCRWVFDFVSESKSLNIWNFWENSGFLFEFLFILFCTAIWIYRYHLWPISGLRALETTQASSLPLPSFMWLYHRCTTEGEQAAPWYRWIHRYSSLASLTIWQLISVHFFVSLSICMYIIWFTSHSNRSVAILHGEPC